MSMALRVHLCTTPAEDSTFAGALRGWLSTAGYTLTIGNHLALPDKLDAARASDCCILLLGATFGHRDPLMSFADNELEAAVASDSQPGKLLIFALPGVDEPTSAEQQECIVRWRNFTGGTFQAHCHTPEELIAQARSALVNWQPPLPDATVTPLPVPSQAVMISSTGDLVPEREVIRTALIARHVPVIDYLHAASEAATPLDRVTTWARECQALFLILGQRYGYVSPADGLGVTELEFVTAWHSGRPIVVFEQAQAAATADPDQRQFIARVHMLIPPAQIHLFADLPSLERAVHAVLNVAPPPPAPSVAIQPSLALGWYRRQVQRWLGIMPHLTQPAGMPLTEVPFAVRPGQSDASEGAAFAVQADTQFQAMPPDAALERWPRFVLRGNPGAGKSTIMHWYAVSAPAQIVPVYLRLSAYARARQAGQVESIFAAMLAEEQRLALTSPGTSLWRDALLDGRGLVLLDGFDEVPTAMQALVAADILQLARSLPDATRIVVSARIAGYRGQLEPVFPAIDVLPLDVVQRQTIVTQWISAAHPTEDDATRRSRAQGILGILLAAPRLAQWAQTPLLLTLFTALADAPRADVFLHSITPAEIYRRGLRLLLGHPRTGTRHASAWHWWAKERLLLGLARHGTLGGHGEIFTSADMRSIWEADHLVTHDPAGPDMLLRDLVEGDGVLLRVAEDQYTFLHPTFQEYLAACTIATMPPPVQCDLVLRHRLSDAWEEITSLLASELDRIGQVAEADQVVQALLEGDAAIIPEAHIPDPLHLALQRAARCQGSRPPRVHDEVGERVVAAWRQIWAATDAQAHPGTDMHTQNYLSRAELWGYLRLHTIRALAQIGPAAASALPELTATLDLPSSIIRSYAEQTIRYLADSGVTGAQALLPRLTALQQRESALRLAQQADATIPELQQALRSGDPVAQAPALTRLWPYGPAAAAALADIVPLLHAPVLNVRLLACQTLGKLGAEAVTIWHELFQVALHDADGAVQLSARRAIGTLAAYAPGIVVEVTQHLAAPDAAERTAAGLILCECGAAAIPAIPQVLHLALYDPDQKARTLISIGLKNLQGLVVPHLPVVREALRSPQAEVRRAAEAVAEQLGPIAAPLVEDLCALLPPPDPMPPYDPGAFQRAGAALALGAIGPAAIAALPQLRRALNEPAPMVRAALKAIPRLGPQAVEVLPDIRAILARSWQNLNAAGGLAMPPTPDSKQIPNYTEISLITDALQAFATWGPLAAPAVPDIRRIIGSTPPAAESTSGYLVWSNACTALRQIGVAAVSAISDLLHVTQHSPRQDVRFLALHALTQITAAVEDVGPAPSFRS